MIEPYNTTYGALLNITPVGDALLKYINSADLEDLEYDYPSTGDTRSVYITGYNDEERELPVWEHPYILKTLKGHTVVVSDIRQFIKPTDTLVASLDEIVRVRNSLDFIILRALLTKDFLSGDIGEHRAVFSPSTTAMGVWINGMISTISLTPEESFRMEVVTSMYANTLYYTYEESINSIDTITARVINGKRLFQLGTKEAAVICAGYRITDGSKVKELVDNIRAVVFEEKRQFITVDSLIGSMGNVWYGPGSSETPIMALENMPIWLALLYSVVTNRSYAKSRIGQMLNRHSRVIDAKAIDKHFSNYLRDIKVS